MRRAHLAIPDGGRICWRPEWVNPLESLWALLQEVAFLNVIPARLLARFFAVDGPWRNGGPLAALDLRAWGCLDANKVAHRLSLCRQELDAAVLTAFIRLADVQGASTSDLRFCPICLRERFHCVLYQLYGVVRCPMHDVELQTRCANCHRPLGSYYLSDETFAHPYACHHCGAFFAEVSTKATEIRSRTWPFPKLERLGDRIKRHARHTPWSVFSECKEGSASALRGRRLARQASVDGKGKGMASVVHGTLGVSGRSSARPRAPPSGALSAEEAFRVYRSVRHHLERCYLLGHSRCAHRIARGYWYRRSDWVIPMKLCLPAHAFLLWRLYWERRESPGGLVRHQARSAAPPTLAFSAIPKTTSDWANRHVLALRLLGSFEECLLLARAMERRGAVSFVTRSLAGRREPYWVFEFPEGEEGQAERVTWRAYEPRGHAAWPPVTQCRMKPFETLGHRLL